MAKVLITESHLNNIATAIRSKNESGRTYKPGEMAQAIMDIETWHEPVLQSKTTEQNGTVVPDPGYDGLNMVIVNVSGGGGSLRPAYGLRF